MACACSAFLSSPAQSTGLPVVLNHGWEGSAESLYVLSLAQRLFEQGFDVVRLNLRDHGETHQLNRDLFHSCRLPEVVGAVHSLQQLFPHRPLQLVGFSLGGNFMLRVAAQARVANLELARVVAVSPVLDPVATLNALQKSIPGYEAYFVRKWTRSLVKKQAAWPEAYDFRELKRQRDLKNMTAELVRRHTEFASLEDYLNGYAITGARLADLKVPSSIITSLDDPIIPAAGLLELARPPGLSADGHPARRALRVLRAPLRPDLAGAAHPHAAGGACRGAGVAGRGDLSALPAPKRARFSSNCTIGSPLVTVTTPSMTAPLATAMLRAWMSARMTAVPATSSLPSMTSRPVIRPATTPAAAWISPSHWAVTDMRSMPPTRPSPRMVPHTTSGPGVSRSPVRRTPSATKVGESPIWSISRRLSFIRCSWGAAQS